MTVKSADEMIAKLDKALESLQTVAQGRVYNVGTKILWRGRFGVVTDLNQGSEDPTGSTIDIRLEDGTVMEDISVTSSFLELFKS